MPLSPARTREDAAAPLSHLRRGPAPEASTANLIALGLAGMCAFLNMYATQPILPLVGTFFGVAKAQAALTVSAPTIAVALGSPLIGALADRLGQRRVIVASLFALIVPTALAATSQTIGQLVAWRFFQGLAVPGVYAVGIAYASALWPGRTIGRAMAAIVTGNVVGGFLGRAVSGLMAEQLGWRASFLALGALTLVGAGATWRWLPRSAPAEGRPREERAAPRELRRLLDVRLLTTFAVGFNVLFVQVATFTYVIFYLSEPPFRLGAAALSWLFVVYLVGAVVTPTAGRWIGRVGARRVLILAVLGGLTGAACTLLPSVPMVVLGLALICTAVFVGQSAGTSHLSVIAPAELRSVASGVYLSSYYLGGAVGGLLPALAWHVGGWPACIGLVVLVQLATLAVALRYWRSGRLSVVEGR